MNTPKQASSFHHNLPALHWFEGFFEQMQTAVLCTDDQLNVIYANNSAEMLLNTSKKHLMTEDMSLYFAEELALHDLSTRALQQKQAFSLSDVDLLARPNLYFDQKNTATALVDIAVTPLMLPENNTDSYLLFEIKAKGQQASLAHQTRQRQQQEITRTLIRSVAHEIKNPLASIRGAAQLMQMTATGIDLPTDKKNELFEYTGVMIKESDRIKSLADAMLGSNKLLQKQPLNIHEPLEHVMTLVKSQFPSVKLKRDYDSSLPEVSLDNDRFIQVFLNICLNAAQAMTDDALKSDAQDEHRQSRDNTAYEPTITLKTRVGYHQVIMEKNYRQVLQVSIIDNGPGIPQAIQKTMFYPLVSARSNGTGLGLSIAQEIIRQHQGMIDFSSVKGRTCFDIFLPFNS